jgi:two-component system chemotaxis response regulator CheY
MRVLLVDDDSAARYLMRRLLVRDFKCTVTEAEDGVEALERLDTKSFDCLFLDLKMPVMSGLEVLEELRQSEVLRALPVVIMTSRKDEVTVRRAIELGVLDYVIKDSDVDRIGQRLKWVCEKLVAAPRHRRTSPSQNDLAAQSLILVVDESSDFRHFCVDVLQSRARVLEVSSGAQALRMGLNNPPTLMLVGSHVGTMNRTSFAKKVRSLKAFEKTDLIAVVKKDEIEATRSLGVFDEVIRQSFIPDAFLATLASVMGGSGEDASFIAQRPELGFQIKSALEQVFGMMLSTEATVLSTLPEDLFETPVVDISILLADHESDLHITLCANDKAAQEIARRMLQVEGTDLSSEEVQSSIAEIANMVGGRIQNGLSDRGVPAQIGLPMAASQTAPLQRVPEDIIRIGVEFPAADGCVLTLGVTLFEGVAADRHTEQERASA